MVKGDQLPSKFCPYCNLGVQTTYPQEPQATKCSNGINLHKLIIMIKLIALSGEMNFDTLPPLQTPSSYLAKPSRFILPFFLTFYTKIYGYMHHRSTSFND